MGILLAIVCTILLSLDSSAYIPDATCPNRPSARRDRNLRHAARNRHDARELYCTSNRRKAILNLLKLTRSNGISPVSRDDHVNMVRARRSYKREDHTAHFVAVMNRFLDDRSEILSSRNQCGPDLMVSSMRSYSMNFRLRRRIPRLLFIPPVSNRQDER